MKMKSFLIIGMGSFGHHLCRSLAENECEIMVVDKDSEAVEDVLPLGVSGRVGDCTNIDVLRSFSIDLFDACFVCMGTNFKNSLQIASFLKELGAKKVYAKADEDIQAKFLKRNGADVVIYPEKNVAEQIAIAASSDNIFDCIPFVEDYYIAEIRPMERWLGRTVVDVNFRARYNLNIVAVKQGEGVIPIPGPNYVFNEDEHIMVLGHINDIRRVAY